ncbi:hypothetical protein DB346_09215 [Verrucomicrobia bacterium LW23]|nr:hypothetical protein DB346_09215 [Verrucomicrobia bacterium LW23]
MSSRRLPTRRRFYRHGAFSLLEIVLALCIYSIAILGLAQCLLGALRASADNAQRTRIRLAMQNHLAEVRPFALEAQSRLLASDIPGVTFTREIRPFPIRNGKGHLINGLMAVRITATWDTDFGPTSDFAEIYLPASPPGAPKLPH